DFNALKFGNLRIALLHLDNGSIDVLRHMDQGKNIDPAWAPDGRSLAFVSDRNGISNIFPTTCPTGTSTSSPTCSRESPESPRSRRASPGRTKRTGSRSPTMR